MAATDILNSILPSPDTQIFWEDYYILGAAVGGNSARVIGPNISSTYLTTSVAPASTGLTVGTYSYAMTVGIANGTGTSVWAESTIGSTASVSVGATTATVTIDLSNTIPNLLEIGEAVAPTRIIYRAKNAGSWQKLDTIRDPAQESYIDNITTPSGGTYPATSNLSIPFVGSCRTLDFPISALNTSEQTTANLTTFTTGATVPEGEIWQIVGVSTTASTSTGETMAINGFTLSCLKNTSPFVGLRPILAGPGDIITTSSASNWIITYNKLPQSAGMAVITKNISTGVSYTVGTGTILVLSHFYPYGISGVSLVITSSGIDFTYRKSLSGEYQLTSGNPIHHPLIIHQHEVVKATGGNATINGYLLRAPS